MSLSDYGATYMLNKVFENTDLFQVALFTSGTPDDTPVLAEVSTANAGYARVNITGATGGASEYQDINGAVSVVDTGIAAYKFITNTSSQPITFTFTGALTGAEQTIIGYAILMTNSGTPYANPFAASTVLDSKLLDNPFTPRNNGDALVIDSISIRLSKGTVS